MCIPKESPCKNLKEVRKIDNKCAFFFFTNILEPSINNIILSTLDDFISY